MSSSWNTYIIKNISSGGGGGGACVPFCPAFGGRSCFSEADWSGWNLVDIDNSSYRFQFLDRSWNSNKFCRSGKNKMQFQIWCCFLLLGIAADATRIVNNPTCIRQPEGVDASKTPGDNGYRLKISGNPDKYFPGEVYTGQQPLNLFLNCVVC